MRAPKTLTPGTFLHALAAVALAVAVVLPVTGVPRAGALTSYVVTRTDDPVPDGCNSGVDCSLREAIEASNADGDDSVVTFNLDGTFAIADGNDEFTILDDGSFSLIGNGTVDTIISAQDGIDGANRIRVFRVIDAEVDFRDLTVTGGDLLSDTAGRSGAGIQNTGVLTLDTVKVEGNQIDGDVGAHGAFGGGIWNTGTLHVVDSSIRDNTLFGSGPDAEQGAGIVNTGTITMSDSELSGNSARGSAGMLTFGGDVALDNTDVTDNLAGDDGGAGIRNQEGTVTMTGGSMTRNSTSGVGGAILNVTSGTAFTTDGVTIEQNSAAIGGGVLGFDGSTFEMNGGSLTSNHADQFGGGLATAKASAELDGVTIDANTATVGGAGVGNGGGSISVVDSQLTSNVSAGDGGGIFVGDFAGFGPGTLDVTDTEISGNTADDDGGGIFLGLDGAVDATGNDIVANGPNDCGFEDNGSITNGGGSTDSDQTCFPPTPPGPPTSPDPNTAGTSNPATLPATGAGVPLAVAGAALVAAGGLVLALTRRRGALI